MDSFVEFGDSFDKVGDIFDSMCDYKKDPFQGVLATFSSVQHDTLVQLPTKMAQFFNGLIMTPVEAWIKQFDVVNEKFKDYNTGRMKFHHYQRKMKGAPGRAAGARGEGAVLGAAWHA